MIFQFGKKKTDPTMSDLINEQMVCCGDQDLATEQQREDTVSLLCVVEDCLSMLQSKYEAQNDEGFEFNDSVYVVCKSNVHQTKIDFACTLKSEGRVKFYLQELGFWRKLRLGLFTTKLWYEYCLGFAGQDFFRTEIEAKVYLELKNLRLMLQTH